MKQYLDVLKKNPSSRVFVEEIVLTAVEMQRHDAQVSRERAKWGTQLTDANTQYLLKADKVRCALLDRHKDALSAIGFLPKDQLMKDEPAKTLSDIYKAYAQEINQRRRAGDKIGKPSVEAVELARKKDMDPERYGADALPDDVRDELLDELETDE